MLSICIPVYNYSFINLAKALHTQCIDSNIPFEILISDDCSTEDYVQEDVEKFKQLSFTKYLKPKKNLGNDLNRNSLANHAQYEWLLFIDADTMPLDSNFIPTYLKMISDNPADAYSGGIVYDDLRNSNHILKWKHGKSTEEISLNLNEDDYLGFRGNNFLIKKSVFQKVPFVRMAKKYGYIDTVFGINLKLKGYKLKLINNPVIHLGLINSKSFITKTEIALENAIFLASNYPDIAHKIRIIRLYKLLKRLHLTKVVARLFASIKTSLSKQLLSSNPNLYVFQLYKLGYLCKLHSENKAKSVSS